MNQEPIRLGAKQLAIMQSLWNRERATAREITDDLNAATPTEPEFQYRALWGQFLRSDWSLNEERADTFLGRVVRLDDPAQAVGCFRFQVLQTHAPISAFFAYYGL